MRVMVGRYCEGGSGSDCRQLAVACAVSAGLIAVSPARHRMCSQLSLFAVDVEG